MATSQNQGFIEQLREMRATRTQQLRQGNQEAALLNKQITALTNLDRTMRAVLKTQNISSNSLRDINTKQNNMIRQTDQMSKSINNLSTSITRSIGNLASSAVRGTGSAVGSAGGAVVGAASSVSSAIVSGLVKTLPFAIAGVIGKMFVYDKMDESTKKELGDSFGGLMSSIFGGLDTSEFGKAIKPITKEIGIVFGALGDTLGSITDKLSGLVKKLPAGVEKVGNAVEKVGDVIKNPPAEVRAIGRMANDVANVVSGVVSGTSLPEYETVKTGVATVGAGAIAAGTVAVGKNALGAPKPGAPSPAAVSSSPTNSTIYKPNQFAGWMETPANKEAAKEITKKGEKVTKVALVGARLFAKLSLAGGKYMAELAKLVYKTKFGGFFGWAGILVQAGVWWYVQSVLDEMAPEPMGDGTLSKEEYYILTKQAAETALVTGAASTVGSSFGFGAGMLLGGRTRSKKVAAYASTGLSFAGGVAGSTFAEFLLNSNRSLPESLTSESGVSNNNSVLTTATSARDAREARKERPGAAKPQGAINPSPASSSSSNNGFERFKGAIGRAETESEPDPYRARNRAGSSASGKYQVIKDTFERYSKIKGSPVYGMTFEEFQNSSPEIQEALMDYMLQDYNRILTAGKVPINEKTLYLAHFLGPETAVKVYNADPYDPLSKYITKPGLYNLMIKQNPGLVTVGTTTFGIQQALGKRVSSRMAGNRPSTSTSTSSSFAAADPSTATTSTSYADNYARRSKEAKDAEKYEEGSDSFVGPMLAKNEKSKPSALSAFASQFSIESFTSDFAAKTKELTDVVDSMFAAQTQQAPTIMADNSSVTNVTNNSSGGGGGLSINQVISNHMSNMNWQFNTMSGGARA